MKIKFMLKKRALAILFIFPFILISLLHVLFTPGLFADETMTAELVRIIYNQKAFPILGGPSVALGYPSAYPPAYYLLGAFIYFFTGEDILFLKLLSWVTSIFFILLIYVWSKELFKTFNYAFISIFLFLALPVTILFSRLASSHMLLTFYLSLSCYFLFKFSMDRRKKFLYLSSLFGSLAALVSFLGLIYLPLLFLLSKPNKKYFKSIIISSLFFFLLISPWYMRNLIFLGNPLWPNGSIGKYIDSDIHDRDERFMLNISKTDGFNYSTSSDLIDSIYRLLNPRFDWHYTNVRAGLRPIFIIFALPALLLYIFSKNKDKQIKFFIYWFLIILVLYILFFNWREIYLILISVPTVFLSVYFIKRLFEIKIVKEGVIFLLISIYIYFLYVSIFLNGCSNETVENFLYIQHFGDKWKQLELCYTNNAKMWQFVNENIPKDALMTTYDYRLYYYNRTIIEMDSWKLHDLFHTSDVSGVHEILKSNNISFVVIKETKANFVQNFGNKWKESDNITFSDYKQYFSLVKEIGMIKLYKVI